MRDDGSLLISRIMILKCIADRSHGMPTAVAVTRHDSGTLARGWPASGPQTLGWNHGSMQGLLVSCTKALRHACFVAAEGRTCGAGNSGVRVAVDGVLGVNGECKWLS